MYLKDKLLRICYMISVTAIFDLLAVSGKLTKRQRCQFKHHALIGCVLQNETVHWMCNGAIINNLFVAAPASCVDNCKNFKIRVGSIVHPLMNITTKIDEYLSEPGTKPYNAPGYVQGSLEHDLALLQTNKQIIYSQFVGAVSLTNYVDFKAARNVPSVATAFGELNYHPRKWKLQRLRFKVLDDTMCSDYFPNITGNSICAKSTDYDNLKVHETLCDKFGAPLVLMNDCRTLIGIYRYSRETCDKGGPESFVNIGYYLEWIRKTAKFDLENLPTQLQRNFKLMRDLDTRAQNLMQSIDEKANDFMETLIKDRASIPEEIRKEKLKAIQNSFALAKEYGDDKVQLAIQTYELVDKHIRRLESDLERFEGEI